MFLHLQYHPHGKKYPNLLKSWDMERFNFLLSVLCFYVFTITPLTKNIQICWNFGPWKGSTFGSIYSIFTSLLSPPWWKISKFAKIWEHEKVNIWLSIQCFYSSLTSPWRKTSKFAKIFGHGKIQLLAQGAMIAFTITPMTKKYPNLLKIWAMERVHF